VIKKFVKFFIEYRYHRFGFDLFNINLKNMKIERFEDIDVWKLSKDIIKIFTASLSLINSAGTLI